MICFRLLDSDDPAEPLAQAVAKVREGENSSEVYSVNPTSFHKVPNAPFAYWVSENIRGLFAELPQFEGEGRTAKQGLASGDDFRFVRTTWETSAIFHTSKWVSFAKGGSYSPYYADIHLMINWLENGQEIKSWAEILTNSHWSKRIYSTNYFFQKGLTWSDRTNKFFAPRAWPKGGIFSVKGSCGFYENEEIFVLGLMNTSIFNSFLSMMVGSSGEIARSYQVGTLGRVPFPSLDKKNRKAKVAELSTSAWSLKRSTDTANQTSHAFYAPALSPGQFGSRNKKATTA